MPTWLNSVKEYAVFFTTMIAALGLIWRPIKGVLDKSMKTIKDMDEAMKAQAKINEKEREAIQLSIKDRKEIRELLMNISNMSQTQTKIEINKITERSLERGHITPKDRATLGPLWIAYKANKWNHVTSGDVEAALTLPTRAD